MSRGEHTEANARAVNRLADASDDIALIGQVAGGPEAQLLRQELRTQLSRALTSLSPEHRAVIGLTYYEGCTYREIASIVGCPIDTVKTRMFHARRRLKSLLAERGQEAA